VLLVVPRRICLDGPLDLAESSVSNPVEPLGVLIYKLLRIIGVCFPLNYSLSRVPKLVFKPGTLARACVVCIGIEFATFISAY